MLQWEHSQKKCHRHLHPPPFITSLLLIRTVHVSVELFVSRLLRSKCRSRNPGWGFLGNIHTIVKIVWCRRGATIHCPWRAGFLSIQRCWCSCSGLSSELIKFMVRLAWSRQGAWQILRCSPASFFHLLTFAGSLCGSPEAIHAVNCLSQWAHSVVMPALTATQSASSLFPTSCGERPPQSNWHLIEEHNVSPRGCYSLGQCCPLTFLLEDLPEHPFEYYRCYAGCDRLHPQPHIYVK